MKRTLIAVAVLVAFAMAASGATISVVTDKLTYTGGETIHITITGDSQGAKDNGIYGRLLYEAALTETITSSQGKLTSGGAPASTGNLARGDGFAEVFDAIINLGSVKRTVDQLEVATATLTAEANGIVHVSWATGLGFELDFFGLTSTANGGTVPVQATTFTIIPEPATAALIGLGLIGLVLGGRRRS